MEHFRQVLFSVMLLFISTIASAQNISVSGIVKDANGDEIIGASVLEKGTKNGTITDISGNFRLSVKEGATLVISYVGKCL